MFEILVFWCFDVINLSCDLHREFVWSALIYLDDRWLSWLNKVKQTDYFLRRLLLWKRLSSTFQLLEYQMCWMGGGFIWYSREIGLCPPCRRAPPSWGEDPSFAGGELRAALRKAQNQVLPDSMIGSFKVEHLVITDNFEQWSRIYLTSNFNQACTCLLNMTNCEGQLREHSQRSENGRRREYSAGPCAAPVSYTHLTLPTKA